MLKYIKPSDATEKIYTFYRNVIKEENRELYDRLKSIAPGDSHDCGSLARNGANERLVDEIAAKVNSLKKDRENDKEARVILELVERIRLHDLNGYDLIRINLIKKLLLYQVVSNYNDLLFQAFNTLATLKVDYDVNNEQFAPVLLNSTSNNQLILEKLNRLLKNGPKTNLNDYIQLLLKYYNPALEYDNGHLISLLTHYLSSRPETDTYNGLIVYLLLLYYGKSVNDSKFTTAMYYYNLYNKYEKLHHKPVLINDLNKFVVNITYRYLHFKSLGSLNYYSSLDEMINHWPNLPYSSHNGYTVHSKENEVESLYNRLGSFDRFILLHYFNLQNHLQDINKSYIPVLNDDFKYLLLNREFIVKHLSGLDKLEIDNNFDKFHLNVLYDDGMEIVVDNYKYYNYLFNHNMLLSYPNSQERDRRRDGLLARLLTSTAMNNLMKEAWELNINLNFTKNFNNFNKLVNHLVERMGPVDLKSSYNIIDVIYCIMSNRNINRSNKSVLDDLFYLVHFDDRPTLKVDKNRLLFILLLMLKTNRSDINLVLNIVTSVEITENNLLIHLAIFITLFQNSNSDYYYLFKYFFGQLYSLIKETGSSRDLQLISKLAQENEQFSHCNKYDMSLPYYTKKCILLAIHDELTGLFDDQNNDRPFTRGQNNYNLKSNGRKVDQPILNPSRDELERLYQYCYSILIHHSNSLSENADEILIITTNIICILHSHFNNLITINTDLPKLKEDHTGGVTDKDGIEDGEEDEKLVKHILTNYLLTNLHFKITPYSIQQILFHYPQFFPLTDTEGGDPNGDQVGLLKLLQGIKYERNAAIEKRIIRSIEAKSKQDFRFFVLYLIYNLSRACPRYNLYKSLDLALIEIPSLLKYLMVPILNDFFKFNTRPGFGSEDDLTERVVLRLNDILLYNVKKRERQLSHARDTRNVMNTDKIADDRDASKREDDIDYLSLEILFYLIDHIDALILRKKNDRDDRLVQGYINVMKRVNKVHLAKCSYYCGSFSRCIRILQRLFKRTYDFENQDSSLLVNTYQEFKIDLTPLSGTKEEGEEDDLWELVKIMSYCYYNLNDKVTYNFLQSTLSNTREGDFGEERNWTLNKWDLKINDSLTQGGLGELEVKNEAQKTIKMLYLSVKENNSTNYLQCIENLSTLNTINTLLTQGLKVTKLDSGMDDTLTLANFNKRTLLVNGNNRVENILLVHEVYKRYDQIGSIRYLLDIFNDISFQVILAQNNSNHFGPSIGSNFSSNSVRNLNPESMAKMCNYIGDNLEHVLKNERSLQREISLYRLNKLCCNGRFSEYYALLTELYNRVKSNESTPNGALFNSIAYVQLNENENTKDVDDLGKKLELLLCNYHCNLDNNLLHTVINNVLKLLSTSRENYELYYIYSSYLYELITKKLSSSAYISLASSQSPTSSISESSMASGNLHNMENTFYNVYGDEDEKKFIEGVDGVEGIGSLYDYSNLLMHTLEIHFLTLIHYSNTRLNSVGRDRESHQATDKGLLGGSNPVNKGTNVKEDINLGDLANIRDTNVRTNGMEWVMIRLAYLLCRFSTEGNVEFERGIILKEDLTTFLFKKMNVIFLKYLGRFPTIFYYTVINQLIGITVHKHLSSLAIVILNKLLFKYTNVMLWYISYFGFSKIQSLKQLYNTVIEFRANSKVNRKVWEGIVGQKKRMILKYNALFSELYDLSKQNIGSDGKPTGKSAGKGSKKNFMGPLKLFFQNLRSSSANRGDREDQILVPKNEMLLYDAVYYEREGEYIVDISSEITVLKSKQKPKLISFITSFSNPSRKVEGTSNTEKASDVKELDLNTAVEGTGGRAIFLLKNELRGDLRKDLRSMDSVKFVNKLIERCFRHRLAIFSVITISEIVGLIQFLPNLVTLKQLGESASVQGKGEEPKKPTDLMHKYVKCVHNKDFNGSLQFYNKILAAYDYRYNSIVSYFLNNASTDRGDSSSPKDDAASLHNSHPVLGNYNEIYEIQRLFNLSCSIWSVFGYILGLGDRHAENILFNVKNGNLVHVDFDCLFDKGMSLMVPEIVPFRLTPTLIMNLGITGINVNGLFYTNCLEFMKLLMNNKEVIKLVLFNFILDPMIKWINIRNKITSKLTNHLNIYISTPCYKNVSFLDELGRGEGAQGTATSTPQLETSTPQVPMKNKDDANKDVKILFVDECVKIELQIEQLIRTSTDKHLLSRMYVGWAPWV